MSDVAINESLSYAPDPTAVYDIMSRLAQRLNTVEAQLEEVRRRETSPTATAATANTIALRDASGNLTVTALVGNVTGNLTGSVTGNTSGTHTGAVTGNVTGNLTGNVTGDLTGNTTGTHTGAVVGTTVSASSTMTASVGLLTARSGGTAVFALDGSATGSTISISASGSTGTPLGNANNFSGLLMINDTAYDGALSVFLCGGGLTFKLAETIAVYSATSGTGSKVNVYYATNVLTIQNNTANNRVFSVIAFRSRASA